MFCNPGLLFQEIPKLKFRNFLDFGESTVLFCSRNTQPGPRYWSENFGFYQEVPINFCPMVVHGWKFSQYPIFGTSLITRIFPQIKTIPGNCFFGSLLL